MRQVLSGMIVLVMLSAPCCVLAQESPADAPHRLPLYDFHRFDLETAKGNGGMATPGGTPDKPALRITTPARKDWPGVVIKAPEGKWDLSAYEYISVDIHNIDTHDIDVFIRVDNPGATGLKNCITERAFVQPDQRVTLTIPLKRISDSTIRLFGMNGYPQGLYPDGVGLDLTNIVAITPFTGKGTPRDNIFEISNIYAGGRYETPRWLEMTEEAFFPFVDKFGQFIHKDWPGKIHSLEELALSRDAEARRLADDRGPEDWNQWGGWANGPTLKATGHFRVEKYQDKWWMVDPDGRLFFSTGLCVVGTGWAATPVEGRDGWFAELPANDAAHQTFYRKSYKLWSGHYKGQEPLMFDFSTMNLARKYGENWREVYPQVVHRRLRAWGINTIGNWSNSNWCRMRKTPYTMTFFYESRKLRGTGSGFPDVFDPAFAPAVLKGARQFLAGTTDDPWCIGYFLDNEMPWGGERTLAENTLKSPADQPAKMEMIRWLKERYPAVADLNHAWGTSFNSWDAFATTTTAAPKTAAAGKDLAEFTGHIAETYFRTVRDAIRSIAPDKLYLGCRSVGGSRNIVAPAIEFCDIVTYNRYCHSVLDMTFPEGMDAPMMLGEFHFGASDRGLFWNGLVSCDDQRDRARKYKEYVNSALDNPQIVGTHWFQYGDESVTGRGDGENAQCGFVDVCDTPYEETIRAAREIGESMYGRRLGGR